MIPHEACGVPAVPGAGFDFAASHPYTFAKREAAIALIPRSKSGSKRWVRFG